MRYLIYDEEKKDWRYTEVSFFSLLKIYFWLDIARASILLSLFLIAAILLSFVGYL